MSLNVGELHAKLGLDTRDFDKGVDKSGRKFSGFSGDLTRKAGTAAAAGGAALAGLAAKGVAEFSKLERGMNEVFTLLPDISGQAMGDMTQQVRDFSKEFGTLPDKTVPALYQAISAGVPKDNVFSFMETAQKAAIGGVTELETAVDGISSVVNAYGEDVVDATQASDLMFTAVKLGKTDFDQLSRSLFNVIPTASSLGVKFGDVTAALATMTAQGTPTTVATTQLRQMLVELSKAGSDTAETFESISGQTFAEFIAGGGDVQTALQMMDEEAARRGGSISDLFGSVEAGMAASVLSSESGAEDFSRALGEMADSAGATEAAFEQMDQGISRDLEKMRARATDALIGFGEELAPSVITLADSLIHLGDSALPIVQAGLDRLSDVAQGLVFIVDGLGDAFGLTDGRAADMSRALQFMGDRIDEGVDPAVAFANAVRDLAATGPLTRRQVETLGNAFGLTDDQIGDARFTLMQYAEMSADAAGRQEALRDALDRVTRGAELSEDELATLGVTVEKGQDPLFALRDALNDANQAAGDANVTVDELTEAFGGSGQAADDGARDVNKLYWANRDLAEASDDAAGAQGDLEDATDDATGALREQFDMLRAQQDPLFNLRDATDKVAEAQKGVKDAIKEFGQGSDEHMDALSDLAEANLNLRDAEISVVESGGLTREEFIKQQTELGLTRDQAILLADSFEELNAFQFDPKRIVIEVDGVEKNFAHNFGGSGRQAGGPVDASGVYRGGEGDRPELLKTAAGLFVIPGDRGTVFSNAQVERFMTAAQGFGTASSGFDAAAMASQMASAFSGGRGETHHHYHLEGTGEPQVDAQRVGAVESVVRMQEVG